MRYIFLCHLLVLLISFLAVGAEEEANQKSDERKPSVFKVGEDEWVSLPEVFSNLDFFADNTPATEEDIEGQLSLRSTRFWGRIYIDGWPQSIQFFRAHFGIEAPLGRKTFVFAEPRDACQELTNAGFLTTDHVVLANRGNCTFGTKARIVERSGAAAIIIINNEPGLDHLPGPDAHDIQFSVSSIAQPEGQLLEAIYDEGPWENGLGRKLEGYMVPINCENSGATCVPATYEERKNIQDLSEGGFVHIDGANGKPSLKESELPLEYLLAHFGTIVHDNNTKFEIVMAKPPEACDPLENDVKGKLVLVRRGTCPFVRKAEEVQAAGGRAMVVGSVHAYIVRMGVEPRWKGLSTSVPVMMVSKRGYSALVAESYVGGSVSFQQSHEIGGKVWEPLEKLFNGEGWPRSEVYVNKKYEELLETHKAWPDRVLAVKEAYNKHIKKDSTGVKSEL